MIQLKMKLQTAPGGRQADQKLTENVVTAADRWQRLSVSLYFSKAVQNMSSFIMRIWQDNIWAMNVLGY